MAIVYTGNDLANKLAATDVFPFSETVEMYGYGGNDELKGAFLHVNVIYGGFGDDTIHGGTMGNTLYGDKGNDIIECWQGNYSELFGGVGNDSLTGGNEGNLLDGGLGNDTLQGGVSADTYVVGSASDQILETYLPYYDNDPNPRDTVKSTVSWLLGSCLEDLTLIGSTAINATGNELDNILVGNSAANTLNGEAGTDTMLGDAGNDTYYIDNTGDKVYETTTTTSTTNAGGTDKVISSVSFNLSSYTGVSFVENLTLSGTAAISATGNALANTLVGNSGSNILTGGAGSDNLNGGTGADTLVFNAVVGTSSDSGRTVVTGLNNDKGQDTLTSFSLTEDAIKVVATNVTSFVHGTDTTIGAGTGTDVAGQRASLSTATGLIELNQTNNNNWADAGDIAVTFATPSTTLTEFNFKSRLQYSLTGTTAANTLTGGTLSDTLRGGSGNDSLTGASDKDTLYGDSGNDLLRGGAGNDILYGGTGQDIFRLDTPLSSTSNVDQIKDLSAADDTIQLENSIFTKFGTTTTGTIDSAYVKAISTGEASDSNDYIIYNKTTGGLYYDADGGVDGNADGIQIALLGTKPVLTYADFVLV